VYLRVADYQPILGWVTGLEPAASGATVRRSNQLSYTHHEWLGTPGGIRTPDLEIRSLPLYPAELRAHETSHLKACAAKRYGTCGDACCQWSGRRDSNPQQSAWKADALPIELRPHVVGPTGFEPATLCSQSRCATKLRYGPTLLTLTRPHRYGEASCWARHSIARSECAANVGCSAALPWPAHAARPAAAPRATPASGVLLPNQQRA
jgi:hypothetical protein